MVDSETARNALRGTVVLVGFLAGFLVVAGIYGLLVPERLVEQGLASITVAYLVSLGCLLAGVAGLLLQRYAAGRLRDA